MSLSEKNTEGVTITRRFNWKAVKFIGFLLVVFFIVILFLPYNIDYPIVKNCKFYFNKESYWQYPWGVSNVHRGIDFFAPQNTKVVSPVDGLVIKVGQNKNGGNIVIILGSQWHSHYLAHLNQIYCKEFSFVKKGQIIATIGNTGNAINKEPHVHYSIFTIIPHIWNYDEFAYEGYDKMFYLNPNKYLEN